MKYSQIYLLNVLIKNKDVTLVQRLNTYTLHQRAHMLAIGLIPSGLAAALACDR